MRARIAETNELRVRLGKVAEPEPQTPLSGMFTSEALVAQELYRVLAHVSYALLWEHADLGVFAQLISLPRDEGLVDVASREVGPTQVLVRHIEAPQELPVW